MMFFYHISPLNRHIFLRMCQKFVEKFSLRVWGDFCRVLIGKMSIESRCLFDNNRAESLLRSLVIYNRFNSKYSSLRNISVLRDARYVLRDTNFALLGIKYVLCDTNNVFRDSKYVLWDTNNVLQDTKYVLWDTNNVFEDTKTYAPRDTSNAFWDVNNVLDPKNVIENMNKVHQEKTVIPNKNCCDDGVVKQIPVMNSVNNSGLIKSTFESCA